MGESTRYQSADRLLDILASVQEQWKTVREVAVELGIAESMIRRDLAWLSKQRGLVESKRRGRSLTYKKKDSQEQDFTFPTAFVLLLGEQATEPFIQGGIKEAFERFLKKAKSRLHGQASRKVLHLSPHFRIQPEHEEHLDALVQAILHQRFIRLGYSSPTYSPKEWEEWVTPLSLVLDRSRLYVLVCLESGEYRLRRLDRLQKIQVGSSKQAFVYPSKEEYDPQALFRYSFGPFMNPDPPEQSILLRFYGVAEEIHRTYDWPVPHRITCEEPLEVRLEAHMDPSLENFLLRLGEGVEVLSPPSSRHRMQERLRQGLARYERE